MQPNPCRALCRSGRSATGCGVQAPCVTIVPTERQRTLFESSSDDSDVGGHSRNRASRPIREPIEARFSRVRCLSLACLVHGNTCARTHACTHMHVCSHARTHTDSDAQQELGGRSADSNDLTSISTLCASREFTTRYPTGDCSSAAWSQIREGSTAYPR